MPLPSHASRSLLAAILAWASTAIAADTPTWLAGASLQPQARVVLAQSWASWCHSCAGIAPELAALVRAHPGAAYEATSVDATLAEAREPATRIARAADGLAAVAWGGEAYAERWKLSTVPTVRVLLDGRELMRVEGHPNAAELAGLGQALAGALAGSAP